MYICIYVYTHTSEEVRWEGHMDGYEWFPSHDVHVLFIYIYTYMYECIYLHI